MSRPSGQLFRAFAGYGPGGRRRDDDSNLAGQPIPVDYAHLDLSTGKPCRCGIVSAQEAYTRCIVVPRKERDRRHQAQDYRRAVAEGRWSPVNGGMKWIVNHVHTTAYDASNPETVGAMTEAEARLYRQGGSKAVLEARASIAKEERLREQAEQQRMVSEGQGPEAQPVPEGQEEPREDRGSIPLSNMPSSNRVLEPGQTGEAIGTRGSLEAVPAREEDREAQGTPRDTGARIQAGSQGRGKEQSRASVGAGERPSTGTDMVQALRSEKRKGVGAGDGSEVEAFKPPVTKNRGKSGRPRKYANSAERKRAYRRRRRQ